MEEQLRQFLLQMLLQRPQWVPAGNGLLDASRGRIRGRLNGTMALITNLIQAGWQGYQGSREDFNDAVNAVVDQFNLELNNEILLFQGQGTRQGEIDFNQMLQNEYLNQIEGILDNLPSKTLGDWFWRFFSDSGGLENDTEGGKEGLVQLEHDFGLLKAHYRSSEGGVEYKILIRWGYIPERFNVGETIILPISIEREWIAKPTIKTDSGYLSVEATYGGRQVYSEEGNYQFTIDAPMGAEMDKMSLKVQIVPVDAKHSYRWFGLEFMLWENKPIKDMPIGTNPRVA